MNISNLKDLEKIIQLCRKQGVSSIKVDGIELTLGEAPERPNRRGQPQPEDSIIDMPDQLTEEQLLFFSSGGNPEN